jgi:hypothetical protein
MKPTIDKVIAAYIKIRDSKDLLAKRHAVEMAPLNEQLERLEGWLQASLQAAGVESYKTAQGTAFLQQNDSVTVRDWTALLEWIRKNDEWSMLTASVSKLAVRDMLEQTKELPPGVSYRKEVVTRVRRPKTLKEDE